MARALLGTRLRERRLALGLKQAQAAALAGISPAYLNLIEHNRRAPAPERLADLAQALQLDPAALIEDDSGPMAEALRAVAGAEGAEAERDLLRADDLVARFPAWARLILRQQGRIEALNRTVEALNDRLSHDPHLSASLHEVLTAMASVRSTAGILAETPDLAPDWRARFHRNLYEDSERLAKGAEALVEWLDSAGEASAAGGAVSPQEEVEAWAAQHGWDLAALDEAAIAPLASAGARDLARAWRDWARQDRAAMPQADLAAALARLGPDPVALASHFGCEVIAAMRRLALAGPGLAGPEPAGPEPAGLVICDASGTPVFRKPVDGFALPRYGAACALWPLFTALMRPLQPIETRLETLGAGGRRFVVRAYCAPAPQKSFADPERRLAAMLILPEPPGPGPRPGLTVGASCRICPKPDCAARREASILG